MSQRRSNSLTVNEIHVPLIPECSSCVLNSLQTLIPILSDDQEEQTKLINHAYKRLAEAFEKKLDPVILSIELFRELYEMGNNLDPYNEIKQRSIRAAENALPNLEREINKLEGFSKFKAALSAAIAGNLIDFNTAYHKPDLSVLLEVFHDIQQTGFQMDDSKEMWNTLTKKQGQLAYLADNAGETYFDIPLLRIFKNHGWAIVYIVKQRPMINDATREDVEGTEISKLATIMDNGGWAHGVPKSMVSDEFIDLIRNSDLVISKGQANIETFPEIQREIGIETYYVLRAKCPHIASSMRAKIGENVVLRRPEKES